MTAVAGEELNQTIHTFDPREFSMRFQQFVVALFTGLLLAPFLRAADVSDFLDFSRTGLPGRLYVPPEAANLSEPRPLILFLHGAGETGSNNLAQINGNIDNLLQGAKDQGAFLYAPQATTRTWADPTRTTSVMEMIDEAILNQNVNPDRLYVTGLSMGGGGVWNMLNRFDDRFAAGLPIAAVTPGSDFDAGNLLGKPTWAFHARNDRTVSPQASRSVVDRILSAASGAPLNYPTPAEQFSTLRYSNEPVGLDYTEWPQGGHGIWGPVYDLPEVYDWMFSHTLSPAEPVLPAGGGQVYVNNAAPPYPIGDQGGNAIAADTGFLAVGTIDLADELVAATNAGTLAQLASAFTQFGASLPLGIGNVGGSFFGNLGAPLTASDPLLGKNIYLVVGDGADIQTSDSLFVVKSPEQFTLESPSFRADLVVNSSLGDGELLLGTHGSVIGGLLGSRPGIIAAAVNVPEPTGLVLTLVGVTSALGCMPRKR